MSTSGISTYNDYAVEIVRDAWFDAGVTDPSEMQMSRGLRALNRMLKGWQAEGDFLTTVEEVKLNLTEDDKDYTLDADCTEIMNVLFRRDSNDTILNRYTLEEYKQLTNKTTSGDPDSFYIDMQRAAPILYLYPVPENTTSLVSNDGTDYRCIKDHESAAADEPGVGANTATYWESIGTTGGYTAWASGTDYVSDLVVYDQLRKFEDVTYLTNNLDIQSKYLDAVVANLAYRFAPGRDDLRALADMLKVAAFADDNERGPMCIGIDYGP